MVNGDGFMACLAQCLWKWADLPAVFEDDDRTSASGNPSLMHDVARQIEITVLTHIKALTRVAVLEKVRTTENKMRFALFVSVLGNVERGRKVNHQRCGIGLRVNAKEREKRRVPCPVREASSPICGRARS